MTGYVENADGVATTTQISVYRPTQTAVSGKQLASIAELVQTLLAGDLQGRAFGQRIATAASDRQRADVAADHQARLKQQLTETLAEPPSRARDARLRHIQRLSREQAVVVRSLPPAVRAERGLDEQEVESFNDRSRAFGPPVVDTTERPVTADRPPQADQSNEAERPEASERDARPREEPPQGPPERDGGDGERGPPGQSANGNAGGAEKNDGQGSGSGGSDNSRGQRGGSSGSNNSGSQGSGNNSLVNSGGGPGRN